MEYKLDASWQDITSVAVYGYGKTSRGSIDWFMDNFTVTSVIDNSECYRGQFYRGVPILSLDEWRGQDHGEKIIILAAAKALASIKKSLVALGKREWIDFVDVDSFVIEWHIRFKNMLCLGKVTTSVTERCTFNCRNCNMLMPYYKTPQDYSLDMLKSDADLFFSITDFVTAFIIIGGEPFLFGGLNEYLDYLGQNYGRRIGNIQLITNGSILPDDALLKTIKKYNIEVRLSDYTFTVAYKNRYDEFKRRLSAFDIRYVEFVQNEWIDFGFPHDDVNIGRNAEELRRHMLNCHGMCHWLHDGKYYYCSNSFAADKTGLFRLTEGQDYLSLADIAERKSDGGVEILEFHNGNMKNGYMTFCKKCRGFACQKTVKAGVQIPRTRN